MIFGVIRGHLLVVRYVDSEGEQHVKFGVVAAPNEKGFILVNPGRHGDGKMEEYRLRFADILDFEDVTGQSEWDVVHVMAAMREDCEQLKAIVAAEDDYWDRHPEIEFFASPEVEEKPVGEDRPTIWHILPPGHEKAVEAHKARYSDPITVEEQADFMISLWGPGFHWPQ